jgi:acyl CoA:acetate/3-ketoacid CoA transferase alpha subunit
LEDLRKIFEKYFELKLNEGESKVVPLKEAVREYVKPGTHVYFAYSPFGIVHEIVRQFHGHDANFTVSCLGAAENINILISAGLVKRLVCGYTGLAFPSPVISGVIQRGLQEGLEIENWSFLTIIERLIAGALGLPFMPTGSLKGSSIAEENEERGDYKKTVDQFGNGEIGLVKALKPDITIMHAHCADPAGNAIPMLSPAEEAYGALASKEGVILSVEKIVTTDYLRKHPLCVRVPASIVKCVVEVPFGMHPLGFRGHDGDGYGEDAEFGRRLQEAFREKETTEAWLKEWILDVKSHEGYLRKLGSERLHTLRGRISYDSWKADALKMVESLSDAPPNRSERAAYFALGEIVDSVEKRGYNTILAGIGISHLASWVAAYKLRDKGVPINLVVELGAFGYLPPPGQPFLVSARGMGSCPMLTDMLGILGFIENSTRMFASVSAGQVDRYGNVNSTKVDDFFLFGSGGANDVSVKAKEIVVTVLHDRRRLVEKVPYVTWLGDNVRKVVTDRAVFEKVDGELVLKKVYVREGESEKAAVDAVVRGMGWKPRMAEKLARLGEPGREEILMLRCFDPDRYFLGRLEEK